jgi:hypothetical protein
VRPQFGVSLLFHADAKVEVTPVRARPAVRQNCDRLPHRRSAALWLRWLVVLSGFAQIAGLIVFFFTMWSRIRGAGSQVRESRGVRF